MLHSDTTSPAKPQIPPLQWWSHLWLELEIAQRKMLVSTVSPVGSDATSGSCSQRNVKHQRPVDLAKFSHFVRISQKVRSPCGGGFLSKPDTWPKVSWTHGLMKHQKNTTWTRCKMNKMNQINMYQYEPREANAAWHSLLEFCILEPCLPGRRAANAGHEYSRYKLQMLTKITPNVYVETSQLNSVDLICKSNRMA